MIRSVLTRPTSLLRAGVLAAAAVALCWPLTRQAGLAAAGIGGFLGALAGEILGTTRVRLAGVLVGTLAAGWIGTRLAEAAVTYSWLPQRLGPLEAAGVGDAILWLSIAGPLALALRFGSRRHGAAVVLEMAAVGLALARSVAAHRDGMIHRPIELADWAWSRGSDPLIVLLALGGLGSLVLAALLLSEERRRRVPLHFAVLVAVAALLLLGLRVSGLPEPRAAGDLGLTGEPREGSERDPSKSGSSSGSGQSGRPERVPSGPQGERPSGGQAGSAGSSAQGRPPQMDDLQFRNEYSSNGSQAPVAVAILHADHSPPSGAYYFRQSAFSQFNGRRLVQATRDDVDRDIVQRFPATRTDVPGAPPESEQRMALQTTIGLLADHIKPVALDSPVQIWPAQNPDRLRFRRVYAVVSHVLTLPYEQMIGLKAGHAEWTEAQWKHYTSGPSDPRYARLAGEAVSILPEQHRMDPLGQAVAVKLWLDKNGIYSRRSRHADAEDPTGSFLFGDRIGYCVHFAHAAAFLLRSRGVPARVAAGYCVPESDRGGGSTIMIRGGSGHAWPEVYIEGVGWVVVDPTPERTLDPPDPAADQGLQRMLGQMLRETPKDPDEPPEPKAKPVSFQRMVRALGLILIALLWLGYAVKLARSLAPRLVGPEQLYRVAYRASLDRLAEAGLTRGHAESRESFSRRVEPVAPSFARLTGGHLERALGSERRTEPQQLRRLAEVTAIEVRRGVPAWRWILGTLHPYSWLSAR
jgi:transglutaminase-like putative cysteine protease